MTRKLGFILAGLGAILLAGCLVVKSGRRKVTGQRIVVALGDSITADGGYLRELLRLYGQGTTGKNLGYVGQQVRVVAQHLEEALAYNPTDLIVLAGVNNLAAGHKASKIASDLTAIWTAVKSRGVRLIAVQITPWRSYPTATATNQTETLKLNAWIAASNIPDVVIRTESLGDTAGSLRPEYSSDKLHPNTAGQKRLGRLIFEQAFGG